eukprot:TRINITY_DN19196_c0_g1_i1.p1 TRINITY_DN19196_c0_g1~~TRINITY_DN19196_c0_g1_i1.p1  ORF type:complete len:295 (+),score=49.62 TRINITY_DN19196_c0_g1_i1:186-1070(+)
MQSSCAGRNDRFIFIKKATRREVLKKNEFRPFEESKHLEFLSFKNDCSLFCFGSHGKKRPHNLTIGRHFDHQLLDMLELGVSKYETMREARIAVGSKPMMHFQGELFSTHPTMQRVQNLLIDFFNGQKINKVHLGGLDHLISVTLKPKDVTKEISVSDDGNTILNAEILFRHYNVAFKKSGEKIPRVELEDAGPTINFDVRRCLLASPQMFRHACKLPKGQVQKKEKNMSKDMFGEKGTIHVGHQSKELATMGTRNFKAHRGKKEKRSAPPATVTSDEVGPAVQSGVKRSKTAM